MWSKKILSAFMLILFCGTIAFAQAENNPKKDPNDDYPNPCGYGWQVGINGGIAYTSSDVNMSIGFPGSIAYGGVLRKNLGYSGAIQGRYFGGTITGQSWRRNHGVNRNKALKPYYSKNVNAANLGYVFHNFQTTFHELDLEAVIHPYGMKFHQSRSFIVPWFSGGVGGILYTSKVDALDAAGNPYDYSTITNTQDIANKKSVLDELSNLLDGEYETYAEAHNSQFDPGIVDSATYQFTVTGGAGLDFRLGNKAILSLSQRLVVPFDDLIDGQRWDERDNLSTRHDLIHYTSLGLRFQLGGCAETSIGFVNPLDYAYAEIKKGSWTPQDDDNDGVLNELDREPNTAPGAMVDTRGVTLDSDKDGCPDHEDPEPFSSPEHEIKDCVNVMSTNLDEKRVREIVKEMMPMGGGGDWYLPTIFFRLDNSKVQYEYYDELNNIATVMKKNPSMKVTVTGYADTRASDEYNMELSQNRANAAVEILSTKFGISGDRFIVKYVGESDEAITGATTEAQHRWNRRVTFEVAE